MKVLIANSYYYPNCNGGAEFCARSLAEQLNKMGNSVDVLTLDTKTHRAEINGVNVLYQRSFVKKWRSKKGVRRLIAYALYLFDFVNYFSYIKIIGNNYDVVHTHAIEDFSPAIWLAAKRCGVPIVHTMHDCYLLCPRLFLLKGDEPCAKPRLICKFRNLIYKRFASCVDCFISPSRQLSERIYVKSEVIQNGVVPSEVTARKNNDGVFRIAYLGSLKKLKGTDLLLAAFEQFNNEKVELHIAGSGEMKELVEKAAEENQNIKYYGWVDTQKVNEVLNDSDVLVCPSHSEVFGIVILDAYNNGVPVIASAVGGIPEIVENEKTGLLFEPGNKEELLNCLNRMINDKELYNTCRDGAREAIKQYSVEVMAQKYQEIYERLV